MYTGPCPFLHRSVFPCISLHPYRKGIWHISESFPTSSGISCLFRKHHQRRLHFCIGHLSHRANYHTCWFQRTSCHCKQGLSLCRNLHCKLCFCINRQMCIPNHSNDHMLFATNRSKTLSLHTSSLCIDSTGSSSPGHRSSHRTCWSWRSRSGHTFEFAFIIVTEYSF